MKAPSKSFIGGTLKVMRCWPTNYPVSSLYVLSLAETSVPFPIWLVLCRARIVHEFPCRAETSPNKAQECRSRAELARPAVLFCWVD